MTGRRCAWLFAAGLVALGLLAFSGEVERGFALGLGFGLAIAFVAHAAGTERGYRTKHMGEALLAALVAAEAELAREEHLEFAAIEAHDRKAASTHETMRQIAHAHALEIERALDPPAVVVKPDWE